MRGIVYTVGHGARPLAELISTLRSAEIELLVDVRRFPGSRRHPHFGRESLESALPKHGIAYEWRGESLGGRRKPVPGSRHHAWRNDSFRAYADHMGSDAFRSALDEIERDAEEGRRQAVMCSETLWWRCHRRLIADMLTLDDFCVVHLVNDKQQSHPLHEALRVDEKGSPVYDMGVEAELPFLES